MGNDKRKGGDMEKQDMEDIYGIRPQLRPTATPTPKPKLSKAEENIQRLSMFGGGMVGAAMGAMGGARRPVMPRPSLPKRSMIRMNKGGKVKK